MLDAARRLIREKDDFTTQDLVVEAGVSLQTFYRYFASKDELLLALIADAMTEACDRWTEAAAEIPEPMDRLRFYITAPLESSTPIATKAPACGSSYPPIGTCTASFRMSSPRPGSHSSTSSSPR